MSHGSTSSWQHRLPVLPSFWSGIISVFSSPALQMFPVVQPGRFNCRKYSEARAIIQPVVKPITVFTIQCFGLIKVLKLQWCESEAPQLIPKSCLFLKFGEKNLQIEEVLIFLISLIYLQICIKSSFEYVLALITWYLTRWWLNRNTRGEQAAQRQTWCHFVFFLHCSLYLWMSPLPQTKVWN